MKPPACALLALALAVPAAWPQAPAEASPKLQAGDAFGVLRFVLRPGYVMPESAQVEPGWYRIVVENPYGLQTPGGVALDTEAGAKLAEKSVDNRKSRTSFYVKLTAGRHKLKLGTAQERTVVIEVVAKKG